MRELIAMSIGSAYLSRTDAATAWGAAILWRA